MTTKPDEQRTESSAVTEPKPGPQCNGAVPAADPKPSSTTPAPEEKITPATPAGAAAPKADAPAAEKKASAPAPESDRPSDGLSLRVHFSFRAIKPDGGTLFELRNATDLPFALDAENMRSSMDYLKQLLDTGFQKPILSRYFAHVRDRLEEHTAAKRKKELPGTSGSTPGPSTFTNPLTPFDFVDPELLRSTLQKHNEETKPKTTV